MFFTGRRSSEVPHGWVVVSLPSLGRGDPILLCCGSTLAPCGYLFCFISLACALEVGCAVAAVLSTWRLLVVAVWIVEGIFEESTLRKGLRDKTSFFLIMNW